jgi:hypothetical protein
MSPPRRFPSLQSFPILEQLLAKSAFKIHQVYKAKIAKRPARPAPARRAEALSAAPVDAAPAPEPDWDAVESPGMTLA